MASGQLRGGDGARENHRKHQNKAKNPSYHLPQRSSSQAVGTTTATASARNDNSDDSSSENPEPERSNPRYENWVRISVKSKSKAGVKELKRKLESELDQVRVLVKKLEAKEFQLTSGGGGYSQSQFSSSNVVENVRPKVGPSGIPASSGKIVEKEKKQMVKTSNKNDQNQPSHVPRKEKFPSNKKNEPPIREPRFEFGMDKRTSPLFQSCSNLLENLMKHKYGWVFNMPVDAKGLGLHDYHTIIKQPMDLGTVKTRLNKNWYKSPREFAEDVRLTFSNAMLYNPKGQDVYLMAEQLSKMFEDKWTSMEAKYNLNKKKSRADSSAVMPKQTLKNPPISKSVPTSTAPPPVSEVRNIGRSESMTKLNPDRAEPRSKPIESALKPANLGNHGKTLVSKKPKAKDPDKRDMTFEEKQRLSLSLQSLPSEKLDNIVQIIKKRNQGLCQNDDEIEVDIASVDPETLWELDRFVTNYKKSLSKNKRKAEVAGLSKEEEEVEEEDVSANPNLEVASARVHKDCNPDTESDSSSAFGSDGSHSASG